MKSLVKGIIISLLFILSVNSQIIYESPPEEDTTFLYRGGEKFDIIYRRSFLIATDMPDSVPVFINSSGSNVLLLSYNFILSSEWKLKLQGGLNFFKITFRQTKDKIFPTVGDSVYILERYRMNYVTFSPSLSWVIKRNPKSKKVIYELEVGPVIGVLFSSNEKSKQKYSQDPSRIITQKIAKIPNLNKLRYGIQGTFRYKWVGLFASYRLSSVFNKNTNYKTALGYSIEYPRFSRLEIGLAIIL